MDTSGDGLANVILYLVVLVLFGQVAVRMLRTPFTNRRFPIVAVVATLAIGIPSLLQFAVPSLGAALRRAPDLTLHDGQWWRVLTSIAAQDGGLVAAIFNLVVVAVVVTIGEWTWGRWRTIVLFLLPSIVLNLAAIAWNSPGGGSSFASDGLLMSVCGLAILRSASAVARACALAAALVGLVLVILNDAHGVAMLLGAALGVLFGLASRFRSRRQPEDTQGPA